MKNALFSRGWERFEKSLTKLKMVKMEFFNAKMVNLLSFKVPFLQILGKQMKSTSRSLSKIFRNFYDSFSLDVLFLVLF